MTDPGGWQEMAEAADRRVVQQNKELAVLRIRCHALQTELEVERLTHAEAMFAAEQRIAELLRQRERLLDKIETLEPTDDHA